MEILIADDDPLSQTLTAALVRKLGHSVLLVQNGEEALHAFETHQPDLVLMDGQMPVMDGYTATRRIREIPHNRWTPIVFIAAENDSATVVSALDAGADDYLTKPLHPAMLRAKLAAMARVHNLYREHERQKENLQNYHDAAEEEVRIALHLMQKLVNAEQLDDPALKCLIAPITANFSGDLVAAARSPRGVLHVMLADAVGHGLAAALNVLPIVPCFYSMTAKGFDLDMVTIELNRTLRQYMPVDRFVATTLLSVDPVLKRVKVWNGANPPVLAFDAEGNVIGRFDSKNLALGIMPDNAFDPVVDVLDFPDHCQLFACSDGVVDDFGNSKDNEERQRRTERMLSETPPALRLKRLRSALAARTGDGSANDDMTVVLIDCDKVAVPDAAAAPRMPEHWNFEASFGARDLRQIDVVGLLLDVIAGIPGAHFHRRPLGVIVTELFANALDHGVLGLASALKDGPQGFENFYAARAEALEKLREGSIAVQIRSRHLDGRPLLELEFTDSGRGFRPVLCRDADEPVRHGRGLALVRSLCESVEFGSSGNSVRVTYRLADFAAEELRAVA